MNTQTVEKALDAQAETNDAVLNPLAKRIITQIEKMQAEAIKFTALLFLVVRRFAERADAEQALSFIEKAICRHFAIKDMGGQEAWDKLSPAEKDKATPKLAEIGGLQSWQPTKSGLLRGYNIQIKKGDKRVTIGSLNPTEAKYKDAEKGARVWLAEIRKIETDAVEAYQEELRGIAAKAMAEANKGSGSSAGSGSPDSGLSNDRNKGPQLNGDVPGVIQTRLTQFARVLQGALEVKARNPEAYNVKISHLIADCTNAIDAWKYAEIDAQKAQTQGPGKPIVAVAQTQVSDKAADDNAQDSALKDVPDPTDAELDKLDSATDSELAELLGNDDEETETGDLTEMTGTEE